jgi:hypothetical protein
MRSPFERVGLLQKRDEGRMSDVFRFLDPQTSTACGANDLRQIFVYHRLERGGLARAYPRNQAGVVEGNLHSVRIAALATLTSRTDKADECSPRILPVASEPDAHS